MRLLMRILAPCLALSLASCFTMGPDDSGGHSNGSDGAMTGGALQKAGVQPAVVSDVGLRAAAVDNTKRFEYRDLYVSLTDPTGQRALAPYFMKSDVWTLDKCETLSTTLRHYRFRRIVAPDGKALPEVDPFGPK
jgi:hypothetical protein